MSEAIYDMHAYTRLTDCVLHQILLSTEPELEEVSQILRVLIDINCGFILFHCFCFLQSRKLLQQVERRELYKYIGQTQPSSQFYSKVSVCTHVS